MVAFKHFHTINAGISADAPENEEHNEDGPSFITHDIRITYFALVGEESQSNAISVCS